MLRITKVAEVAGTTFTLAPEWLCIEGRDEANGHDAKFVMDIPDALELTRWLRQELMPYPDQDAFKVGMNKAAKAEVEGRELLKPSKAKEEPCTYDPGARAASQTVELKLGDPSLAGRGFVGRAPGDGATGIVDLGALHDKAVIS